MKKRFILSLIFVCIAAQMSQAQVSINASGAAPDSSAMLDIASTDKGILIPRMTSAERDGIEKPSEGLLIYNTDDSAFHHFDGRIWQQLADQQSLSLDGKNLLITNGDGVSLADFQENLFISDQACDPIFMLSQESGVNTFGDSLKWQSWTATRFSKLSSIEWKNVSAIDFDGGYARIYQGEGTSSALLGEVELSALQSTGWQQASFEGAQIVLEEDSMYTLSIVDTVDNFGWAASKTNKYAFGKNHTPLDTDHTFRIYVDSCFIGSALSQSSRSSWNFKFIDSLFFSDGTFQSTAPVEDQYLTLSDESLSISEGNSIPLEELTKTIFSHPPCGEISMVEQSLGVSSRGNARLWQSWTTTIPSVLSSVEVKLNSNFAFDGGYINIYKGEGNGGTLLGQQLLGDYGDGWQTIDVSSLEIELQSDSVYTMELEDSTGLFTWVFKGNDPYAGGTSSDAGSDFAFKVLVDSCLQTSIFSQNADDHWTLSGIEELSFAEGSYMNNSELFLDGSVGIGVTPSKAKLEVDGFVGSQSYTSVGIYDDGGYGNKSVNANLSIYASASIAASRFIAFSDARIKNIQGISDSEEDLQTLMEIEITDYCLIDSLQHGHRPIKKVIAQQVNQAYPQAVSKTLTDVIPNIYQHAEMHEGWIALETDVMVGDRVRLVIENKDQIFEVEEVTEKAFRVNLNHQGAVFVYGKEVDDFHTVDYEALTTLNISATQAQQRLIEQQQALIERQQALLDAQQQQFDKQQAQLDRLASAFKALSMQVEKTK